ncbi:MAG: hypothetical protein WCV55_00275 [Candidatus Paceibacterota bacterium]
MKRVTKKEISTNELLKIVTKGFDKSSKDLGELARMVAKGFDAASKDLNDFKSDMNSFKDEMYSFKDDMYLFKKDTEENFEKIRGDIFNLGDRYVSRFDFDNLLVRFSRLEQKLQGKKK